jgi:hypothetical protein
MAGIRLLLFHREIGCHGLFERTRNKYIAEMQTLLFRELRSSKGCCVANAIVTTEGLYTFH